MSAKVTSVTTTMSETDLMENIREFVQVEGLTVNNVEFKNNSIEVTANYHKIIDIPFFASVHVASVANNVIRIRIEKIKVLRLGIPNAVLSAALAFAMKKAKDLGITYQDGHIQVDVDDALQKVPHVHVMIDNIIMENGLLAVKVSGIQADVKAMQADKAAQEAAAAAAEVEAVNQAVVEARRMENFNINLASIEPAEDEYSRLRRDLYKRVPLDYKKHYEYIAALPDLLVLGYRVMRDRRVLAKDKWIIGLSLGYFLSPIDIIPDKFPVLGAIDDLALFVFGVNHLTNRIPLPIVVEHWSGDLKTLKFVKDNIGKIMGMTGSSNIERVYDLVDEKLDEKFGAYQDDDFYFKNPVVPTSVEI
ncbi:MAG: YkvA family protein [Clostridiaceae bacterium]